MNANERIISKIKKCLALAASDNPHEAEVALRQAYSLMDKHGITKDSIDALRLASEKRKTHKRLPLWANELAGVIGLYTSCTIIHTPGTGELHFVGEQDRVEVAGYLYDILARKLAHDKKNHLRLLDKKAPWLKDDFTEKRKLAEQYALGWIQGVANVVYEFAENIDETVLTRHKEYFEMEQDDPVKFKKRKLKQRDIDEHFVYNEGYMTGEKTPINHGIKSRPHTHQLTGTNGQLPRPKGRGL